MSLTSGTRIGSYLITARIGVGGMGEVYRATDTNLDRQVAIKVLPELMAADAERLARFDREAKTLAALNHPNIAAIYGLERFEGRTALVMELVEGPTLADRIAVGPLPVDDALAIAKQIAEALETAHEQGIIHRDLKPANIKVRADGAVKVLDFGLAKAMEPAVAADASWSPTITLPEMTQIGIILGTAGYMSPEQAKGRLVDKRSDIWSFGVVLFEMLAGRTLFVRPNIPETLAAVMRDEPDWSTLPPSTPPRARDLLRRCLAKDPRSRLQAVGEARIALEAALNPALESPAAFGVSATASARSRVLPWLSAFGLAAVGIAAAVWALWRSQPAPLSAQLTVRLDQAASITLASSGAHGGPSIAVSPDGQTVAFRGLTEGDPTVRIYIRRLDQLNATPLAGTEGAGFMFFSPDSKSLAFFAGATLKKMPATGGTAVVLAEAGGTRGGDWSEDGRIVFANGARTGLYVVSADGGQPEPLTTLDQAGGEITHRFPVVLPDNKTVLFTASTNSVSYDEATIKAVPLSGGPAKVVLRGAYDARYVPSGQLLYIRNSTLFAVPFDLEQLAVTGKPTPVVAGIESGVGSAIAQYSVSKTGTLLYLPEAGTKGVPITWLDQRGNSQPIREAGRYLNLRLSPDGLRLAMEVFDRGRSNIWILDLTRGVMSRLTGEFAANEQYPLWSPDGRRLVFSSNREGEATPHLYWKRVDGVGAIERLTAEKRSEVEMAGSWLPDGRTLAFTGRNDKTVDDIFLLHLQGDDKTGWKPESVTPLLNSPASETNPAFSPDGRWLAYQSNETGTMEVYVRRYPELDGKEQISSGGASLPTWSRTTHELLYRGRNVMAVTYAARGEEFGASRPRVWAEAAQDNDLGRTFDLHADGTRIAVMKLGDSGRRNLRETAALIFNFTATLRSRVH